MSGFKYLELGRTLNPQLRNFGHCDNTTEGNYLQRAPGSTMEQPSPFRCRSIDISYILQIQNT